MAWEFELWLPAGHLEALSCGVPRRRSIVPGVSWLQVDATLHAALDAAPLEAAIVLTPHAASDGAREVYVSYEPCLNLVISLSHGEAQASITADGELWTERRPVFERVIADAEAKLREGGIADALLLVAERLPELARPAGGSPSRPQRPRRRPAPAVDPSLLPGSRVGPYVLTSRVDHDETGATASFLALGADGLVMLRAFVLPDDPLLARRFEAEMGSAVRLLRAVDHPAIRRMHAAGTTVHGDSYRGEARPFAWLASDPESGTPLTAWRSARPWTAVLQRLCDAAEGVAALATAGILGDWLRLEHIFVGPDGQVRIDVGVGLALRLCREDAGIMGHRALHCLSPEHLKGLRMTSRTTQYTLSAIAWEALYGVPPFSGESPVSIVQAIMGGKIDAPPAGAAAPRRVQRALERGLSRDPDLRWPSIAAWVGALRRRPLFRLLGRG